MNEQRTLREQLFAALKAGQDLHCPTCGRYAKMYRRKLYWRPIRMMYGLLDAHRKDPLQEWHHINDFNPTDGGTSDFSKMKHWGFVITVEKTDPLSTASGLWQLTRSGELFLRGRTHQPLWKDMLFNEIIETATEMVKVGQVVDKKFNYRELLEGMRYG